MFTLSELRLIEDAIYDAMAWNNHIRSVSNPELANLNVEALISLKDSVCEALREVEIEVGRDEFRSHLSQF